MAILSIKEDVVMDLGVRYGEGDRLENGIILNDNSEIHCEYLAHHLITLKGKNIKLCGNMRNCVIYIYPESHGNIVDLNVEEFLKINILGPAKDNHIRIRANLPTPYVPRYNDMTNIYINNTNNIADTNNFLYIKKNPQNTTIERYLPRKKESKNDIVCLIGFPENLNNKEECYFFIDDTKIISTKEEIDKIFKNQLNIIKYGFNKRNQINMSRYENF